MKRGEAVHTVDEKVFGRRLQEIRNRRGLTQLEVAERLGIHQSLVSQYERGYLRLHGALILKLAKILRTSPNEILGAEEPRENGLDRRFLRRLQKVDQLSKRDKQILLATIDKFLTSVS